MGEEDWRVIEVLRWKIERSESRGRVEVGGHVNQFKQLLSYIEELEGENKRLRFVADAAYEYSAGETPHPYAFAPTPLQKRKEVLFQALTEAGYPMAFG